MAGDLVKTKYVDSEIAKQEDFAHTAASAFEIINSIFDEAFDEVVNSVVVAGLSCSQLATPSMNVQIGPGLAYSRAEDKLIHLAAAISVGVTASHASLDRIDTIEVRYAETDFDSKTRALKDPSSGAVTYSLVNTKTKISFEARCLAGSPGSGVAPAVEAGWMKLGEVAVIHGATAIFSANIKNVTAADDATDNSAWTTDKQKTFFLGSGRAIKSAQLAHAAANVTGANTVHGIRQGAANGFDADLLDGLHASSFDRIERTAGSYVEFYHNSGNQTNGSYAKVIEFKVKKSGTYTTRIWAYSTGWNEDIAVAEGDLVQLYAYRNLTGSNEYTVYARVYKNGVAVGIARSVVAGDIGGNYNVSFGLMCAEEGWLYSLG